MNVCRPLLCRFARATLLVAALLGLWGMATGSPAMAQAMLQGPASALPPPPAPGAFTPPGGSLLAPGSSLSTLPPPTAPVYNAPMVPAGQVALVVAARFSASGPAITAPLIWRVYAGKADEKGAYRLIKEERAASPTFVLPVGSYVVHAAFGLATQAKTVRLTGETVREVFDIPAGGIRIEGKVGDARIPAGQISFDIFPGSQFDVGDRRAVAERVLTGDTVVVPEGTYFVVSNYGDANSSVRSDIRVQAGKLTDVTVNHRAAVMTLKLVTARGGEALASTAWSVLTPGGDVIKESIGAFPRVVLQEGDYRAIARNEGKVFERDFKVSAGVDGEIEVLAR